MTEPETPDVFRLNKHLALQLGTSRREADELIEQGKVLVNGEVARLGARIRAGDSVTVDGKPVKDTAKTQYLAFHKPVGYVSSRRAQGDNPTIYDLLPPEYHILKPVGRLDRDSSGLLLLTNDGDFAYQMTHPKFYKTKVYHAQLDHSLEPLHQQMISDIGVTLEDGVSKFTVIRLEAPNATDGPTYEITMHEGRNRQIRRTFAALGYTVTRLHRIQFGRFSLGDLKPGGYAPVDVAPGE
jgi:23S rRNA pseudouridine2605 synthase